MGIFSSDNMRKLLHNKFVILIGDSVQRSIYKDLLVLWHENRFMKEPELRAKGEESFLNDRLIERSELTNGIHYKEVREFKTDHFLIRFYFATRIYNDYVEGILKEYENTAQPIPDVVLLNSCLWDISRYGKNGWQQYQKNMEKFCCRLDEIMPVETCIIWRTTLPVSERARGGFLVKEVAERTSTLLVDVLLANYLAHTIVTRHRYDVIDMHFLFTQQQQRRAKDGVHWNMFAHRRMTNIVLTHISQAWDLGVPEQPIFDSSQVNFKKEDISMNTTEVLNFVYPSTSTSRKLTPIEERYGGPIRSSNEMYNIYNNFYNIPLSQDTAFSAHQAVVPKFKFDVDLPSAPRHYPMRKVQWVDRRPLHSQHPPPRILMSDNPVHQVKSLMSLPTRIGFRLPNDNHWSTDTTEPSWSNFENTNENHPLKRKFKRKRKIQRKPYAHINSRRY